MRFKFIPLVAILIAFCAGGAVTAMAQGDASSTPSMGVPDRAASKGTTGMGTSRMHHRTHHRRHHTH